MDGALNEKLCNEICTCGLWGEVKWKVTDIMLWVMQGKINMTVFVVELFLEVEEYEYL